MIFNTTKTPCLAVGFCLLLAQTIALQSGQCSSSAESDQVELEYLKILGDIRQTSLETAEQTRSSLISMPAEDGLRLIKSLGESLGERVKKFIRPAEHYTRLVGRYHQWFKRYQAVRRLHSGKKITSLHKMIQEEYAKMDRQLIEGKCRERAPPVADAKREMPTPDEAEGMDFVFDILAGLTRNLEIRLMNEMMELAPPNRKLASVGYNRFGIASEAAGGADDDESHVADAMQRLQKITLKWLARAVLTEASKVVRLLAVGMLAAQAKAHMVSPDNPIHVILDTIIMLGSTSTPVAVLYLRDLKFQLAFMAINALDPLPNLVCKLERKIVQ